MNMKKTIVSIITICASVAAFAQAQVIIDPSSEQGKILPMHGVGAGPSGAATPQFYKAAGIPFVRLHDIGNSERHCVEVMQLFPNFEADENDAANYDFTITDQYIKRLVGTGAKVIWRLGNAGHEPSSAKKYGAWPPKDFAKWARICDHIISHYNEGWADGFHHNIEYWEIWNEPDGDQKPLVDGKPRWQVAPHSWGGTMEQYYEFFSTVFKYLKKQHPNIKIGGPAGAGFWANEPFIKAMQDEGVKVDFYSWHRYSRNPEKLAEEGIKVRDLLDRYGWNDVPTILDEWNYVTDWTAEGGKYSASVRKSLKGTAYTAAVLCHMQDVKCTDVLTYYDWRRNTTYNGAFNRQTNFETPTYYVFYNWNKLYKYGTQVKTTFKQKDIYAAAAKNKDGKVRLMVVRFNDDDNVHTVKNIFVPVPEGCTEYECTLSDSGHMNCVYPFAQHSKHGVKLTMEPNSVVFIDFR